MDAEELRITLPADVAEAIRRRVKSGRYGSASEVIHAALRLLDDGEAARRGGLAAIRAKIDEAAEDPRSFPDEEVGERLRARFEREVDRRGR